MVQNAKLEACEQKEILFTQANHSIIRKEEQPYKSEIQSEVYYFCCPLPWNRGEDIFCFRLKFQLANVGNNRDLHINFVQIMEVYKIRWTIEVFFKESKQHLLLGKVNLVILMLR